MCPGWLIDCKFILFIRLFIIWVLHISLVLSLTISSLNSPSVMSLNAFPFSWHTLFIFQTIAHTSLLLGPFSSSFNTLHSIGCSLVQLHVCLAITRSTSILALMVLSTLKLNYVYICPKPPLYHKLYGGDHVCFVHVFPRSYSYPIYKIDAL